MVNLEKMELLEEGDGSSIPSIQILQTDNQWMENLMGELTIDDAVSEPYRIEGNFFFWTLKSDTKCIVISFCPYVFMFCKTSDALIKVHR